MRQKLISNSILLIGLFFLPFYVSALEPTEEFYVNDFANILSDETESYIIKQSNAMYHVDGTQIVVVTVPSLDGEILEEFSLDLARSFGIGDDEADNGLLLLLALEERMFRVEVGYGLEGVLNDAKTGRFQDDYMIPYFKDDKWDEGIINGYNAFFEEIVLKNNLEIDYDVPIGNNENPSENVENANVYLVIIFAVIAGFVGSKLGKELSKKSRAYHKNYNKTLDIRLEKLLKNEPVNKDYANVKANMYSVVSFIIVFIILMIISYHFASIISNIINFFTFYIACTLQFPGNYLNSNRTGGGSSFGGGSSGGSSSFGGSSGGGGSFGGGGSSRGF